MYQAVCKIALFGDGEFDSLLRHAQLKTKGMNVQLDLIPSFDLSKGGELNEKVHL